MELMIKSFLPIIYEDEDLLVLNKASGVASVPHRDNEIHTAVGSALAHFPDLKGIGPKALEPGLIHRLDTGTSGLLVFAKTQIEFNRLKNEWKLQNVKKIYRAWVCVSSKFPAVPFSIKFPIGHSKKSSKRMISITSEHMRSRIRGKILPAYTEVINIYETINPKKVIDIEIQIHTGVMHQIRCHLATLKFPILGDTIYRGHKASRLWLHAWKLTLPLKNNTQLTLTAELPEGWNNPCK
jgi:23S rRNA pseudouridine1911/1915/1917 synthase